MNLTSVVFAIAVLLGLFVVWDSQKHKYYIYDQNKLHDLAKSVIKEKGHGPLSGVIDAIVANLSTEYPGSINMDRVRD